MFGFGRSRRLIAEAQNDNYVHVPVLLNEAIDGLRIKPDGIYVDCTMGGAGHSKAIIDKLNDKGMLIAFDQDDYAISKGSEVLEKTGKNYKIIKSNFVNLKNVLNDLGITRVDGILYDLGVSSFQFDIKERGFSYNADAPLDMRMDSDQYLKAYDIVNTYSESELKRIFFNYGEEKFSASIARNIVRSREEKPIKTTFELVDIIKSSMPAYAKRSSGHPAKKVFQALRIAVNDELNVFEKSLKDALTMLNPGGRICVITFHSLEDRIAKVTFKDVTEIFIPKGVPIKDADIKHDYKIITNKPIIPSNEEIDRNNRAHSAKLRIIEKL